MVQKLAKVYLVANIVRFLLESLFSVVMYNMLYLYDYGIAMMFEILPAVMFYIYITKNYTKGGKQTTLVLTYIFGIIVFAQSFFDNIQYFRRYGFDEVTFGDVVTLLVRTTQIISYAYLVFESATKFKHPKASARFATVYLLAVAVYCVDYTRELLVGEYDLNIITIIVYLQSVIDIVGGLAMYTFWAYAPKKIMTSTESGDALRELKTLYEQNLITEQEYNEKKAEILSSWQ